MKSELPSKYLVGGSEIELHYKRPLFSSMDYITCAEDIDIVLREYINLETLDVKEYFWLILLSNGNRISGIALISIGTVSSVVVNIKEIFQIALLSHASKVIVAHNHPSGVLKPSVNDREVTDKIQRGLKTLEIELLDHLIITSEGFTSFAQEGFL